jgi:quinol-cytochrome oxidoreductase complex cytochrome b subunit
MSFWGATVITNFFSAIPGSARTVVTWLWGGFAIGNPTLQRFFSLHYLLALRDRGRRRASRLGAACGRTEQPDRHRARRATRTRCRSRPYATVKDGFVMVCFMAFFAYFAFYIPNYLGHADNYIPANPAVTPAHIVPEWYYLPFYADPARDPEQAARRRSRCSARS